MRYIWNWWLQGDRQWHVHTSMTVVFKGQDYIERSYQCPLKAWDLSLSNRMKMCVEICLKAYIVWANAKERVTGLFQMAGLCQVQADSGNRVGEERKGPN